MTENAVTVRITHAWAARRAAFESSCRSGSGPASDPDAIAAQIARDVEAAAREELRAIRDAYFRPPAAPATPPGAASSITVERPAAATPNAPPDATVERTPSDPDDDVGFELFHQTPSKTGPAAKPLPPTPQVPGYAILGVLGHGGMGVVYRARHLALDREVALKMILKGPHASPESVARFLGEARAVARLNHPNIVQIYQIDENAGQPSFALEYCPAGSLDKALDKQPQPPAKAAADAETLCRAVQAAHDAGVVHRDLKPSNVLVAADGALKVTDFGLARMADGGDPTGTGSILGSPPYMAPEQAAGRQQEVGPRSDQYSLGATLYEFLTGTPPFRGPTPIETLRQVIDREPVAPSALQPGVPKDLETICLKALAKDPAKRYASAAAMADDLKAFREGRPIAARPVGRGEKAWRWAKRNPRVAALLGTVAALLAVLAVAGAVFTAVYRTKAAEAEGHFREAEGRGVKLTAALDQSEAHFRQAEDRGVKLAAALDQSETNLKESNENYGFAREIAVVVSQKLPAVLQSRVADPAARRDIGDMVAQAMLNRKGGGVRQLPDRVLFTVLLQKADAALDRRDVAAAHAVLIEAAALAERMRATEPKELDKADGHYARVLEKRAYLHLRTSQLAMPGTDVTAERASGRGYIQRAVELARERVKAPRSHELEPSERELNLAEFVALQARFEDDPKEAEAMQKEALALAAAVLDRKADQGAQRFLAGVQYQYSEWLSGQRRRAERKAALEKAVAGMTAYQTANPDDVGVRMTLGEWNRELGDLIYLDGDRAGPMPLYRAAYDLLRPLALNPQALTMEKDMAADAYRAGLDRLEAKKPEEAEAFFRSSFRLAEEAMDRGKVTYELLNLAALAAARCGEYRRATHWTAKVESQTKHKLEQLIEAACCTATLAGCVDTSPDLAHLTPEKRAELKAETVADAVRLLAEWRDVLNLPANAAERDKNIASLVRRLSTEPDLDGIRGEKAFQAFVAETKGTLN